MSLQSSFRKRHPFSIKPANPFSSQPWPKPPKQPPVPSIAERERGPTPARTPSAWLKPGQPTYTRKSATAGGGLNAAFRKRWLRLHDTPKSKHKEHGPKGKHQGAGQAVHAGKIHEGLSGIFTGKNEGAGFMQNAPRPGFNISIAGDSQDIGRRFQQLENVDGVWEGEMEQSYMANLPEHSDPGKVLRAAAEAGKANDQDAVFVRYDGEQQPSGKWGKAKAFTIQTPQGIIDIVNPPPKDMDDALRMAKNMRATKQMAKRFGGGRVKMKHVWTRLLERGTDY